MTAPAARVAGLGFCVPDRVVTNADLEKVLDTNDQWIVERTGIRERRLASPETTLTELATEAARRALKAAGTGPDALDAVILATTTPDRPMPATACEVQAALGAWGAVAFDIYAACTGFVIAMSVGEGMIASGRYRRVLVIGGEKLSRITDWEDRGTAILFADGAGAAVLEPAEGDGRGILSTFMRTDGRLGSLLNIPGGGNIDPLTEELIRRRGHLMRMQGREVFKHAVREMASASDEAVRLAGLTYDDIDWLVPHQANLRIIEATAKHANIPMDKVIVNVDRYGNTSSASIPIAIGEAVADGRIRKGSTLLLVAFGGGLTWGGMVVRW